METTVINYATPAVKVRMSNIKIDVKGYKFELLLATKTNRQKNWREEKISGTISGPLRDWLMNAFEEKMKIQADNEQGFEIVKTGKLTTGFQIFLKKKGIDFKPGILSEMVFECDNTSENYLENPFKLMTFIDQEPKLTLVNVGPKKQVAETDPNTGETKVFAKVQFVKLKDGSVKKAFFSNKYFVRLKQQIQRTVTQYQKPTIA